VPLPGLPAAGSRLVVLVALAETTRLLAGSGETTGFAVLVNRVNDPVDTRITADGLVLWVNEDNLVVLIGGVLINPVGVEDAEIGAATADTFLGGGCQRTLVLELIHTLVGGLAISSTLRHWLLASTSPHTHAVDYIALLGLVPKTASLVWTGRPRGAVDDVQLAELPAADTEQES